MSYILSINKLPVLLSIGAFDFERAANKQEVLLDIKVKSKKRPRGCISDQLADTTCYKELIEQLLSFATTKHFNLIEHFAYEIMRLLKAKFLEESIVVEVTKFPTIAKQKQNISFRIQSDDFLEDLM
ncbi:MAG: dihydroneopterin aldolase [Candidatus Midichloria sp.]|uniref:Dihydroneopterin aldolase n=1 Tax=Hyalomma marginatum TaxID=34627 RepID=A0A8S4BXN3_9ACAR|nr:dihydroneopterin aldolase [Hyalomma marginatum]CAG7600941.1 dihydroneopterin aldolase [Hyalomma marginatum]